MAQASPALENTEYLRIYQSRVRLWRGWKLLAKLNPRKYRVALMKKDGHLYTLFEEFTTIDKGNSRVVAAMVPGDRPLPLAVGRSIYSDPIPRAWRVMDHMTWNQEEK